MTQSISLLILGAGWTSTFLIPLLSERKITHAATSTTGRDGTIPFKFDPESSATEPYETLPSADTVLITFPLKGHGQSNTLVDIYDKTHPHVKAKYIQLGSTGIFSIPDQTPWVTRHSAYDKENARAIAEDELLARGGCVLNLSGLFGGERSPHNWVRRVAKTKEALKGKASLHLIHGEDVARGIAAVVEDFTKGERWMLTNLCVYDWYELVLRWAETNPEQVKWVGELLQEEDIRALPRSMEKLGRCYDSREFWAKFKIMPVQTSLA